MVKIDRSKAPVKKKDLVVPNMIFLRSTKIFIAPCSFTMESISLVYRPAPDAEKETVQVFVALGDTKGKIRKTYHIEGKVGETKMKEGIPLDRGDMVTIGTNNPLSLDSSACLSYNMRIK